MLKYRILIWLTVVTVGHMFAAYVRLAAGIEWGTSDCGTLFGLSLGCALCTASLSAFAPSDRSISKLLGIAQP